MQRSHNSTNKPVISHVVMMGDSLSDRGTLNHRYLFGIIPMSWLSGLSAKSPRGRFTNGYTWSDRFSDTLADQFIIDHAERYGWRDTHQQNAFSPSERSANTSDDILTRQHQHTKRKNPSQRLDPTDIADNVIANHCFEEMAQQSFNLDNNFSVRYRGRDFVRSYVEGGLSSHDYSWIPSTSISRFFSRLILSTLQQKREALLASDKKLAVSQQQKSHTLIVEWSGANDLITLNAKPSEEEAIKAIADRINNIEQLIKQGYRHFVLFNLPDLSLTPRYQNLSPEDRKNAHAVSIYFKMKMAKLTQAFPH